MTELIPVTRYVYYAEEVDPAEAVGWYYHYTLPGPPLANTMTKEVGPFTSRDAALASATAACPANWLVKDKYDDCN
jgi:hypothetical protein